MKLHVLLFGRSKRKMNPIMIDSKHKCENYRDARQNVRGFHEIVPAAPGESQWKQKTATIGGNKNAPGQSCNGYVDKRGFHPHT